MAFPSEFYQVFQEDPSHIIKKKKKKVKGKNTSKLSYDANIILKVKADNRLQKGKFQTNIPDKHSCKNLK